MARQESLLSSSSFSNGFKYNVFLSFRGEDTRHGFTGYLYKALDERGIHTFIDDEELQRGDEITESLVKAIQESRIAIVILSANYASSSFCLDELSNIIDFIKGKGQLVLPVFYKVDPSDVRNQRGCYGEALVNHEVKFKDTNMEERLQKWRTALHQVANLSGFHFKTTGDEYEHKFIENIVKEVSKNIKHVPLPVADYPVGLESRVEEVKLLMDAGSNDGVHMIGIHGIGGVGKTTLALALYNSVAEHFTCLCFLQNVREKSNNKGLLHLQGILLSEMFGGEKVKLASVQKGISEIQRRLQWKKVLLILDDVDEEEQLKALAGRPDWFGPGSRVIITTRDKRLLTCHMVEQTYEVTVLNSKDALELLRWKAFKTHEVNQRFNNILNHILIYAAGLPLALEVMGSSLFEKTVDEWKSALDQYEKNPAKRIQNILKVSFDSLDVNQQKLFLDVACCFKGYPLACVKKILHAHHGFSLDYGIGVLIEKSLMKINVYGHVILHDLIEAMGKEIVRQEARDEPGNRSRLWSCEDIVQVLEENTGSSLIQIIILDFPKYQEVEWDEILDVPKHQEVEWNGNGFKDMKSLKTLIIRNNRFSEDPKHLPNSLRVLEWRGYPSPCLPSNFNPKNLVILELPESRFLVSIDLLMSKKKFVNMKVLNFDHCPRITEIPDVSGVPNLEELSFGNCDNLIKIHKSVGLLNKLKILKANDCKKLSSFPPIKLTSLEELNLSYCPSLENFPEILGKIEKITELKIIDTPIKELPFSIENLTRLRSLELSLCGGVIRLPRSISMMPKLDELIVSKCKGLPISKQEEGDAQDSSLVFENTIDINLTYCKISDKFFREGLPLFVKVKQLTLFNSDFTILPECIKECLFLAEIFLSCCEKFRKIEGIPPILKAFAADKCISLKDLDLTLFPKCFTKLVLNNCKNLQEIRGISSNISTLLAIECPSLTSECRSMLLNEELHEEGGDKVFLLQETRIPEWFEHRFNEKSISFRFRNKIPAISLCFAFRFNGQRTTYCLNIEVNGISSVIRESFILNYEARNYTVLFDIKPEKFLCHDVLFLEENIWNYVKCTLSNNRGRVFLREGGIHVFKQGRSMEDIQFTDQQAMADPQTGQMILKRAASSKIAATSKHKKIM